MKKSPQEENLLKNFKTSKFSGEGFLGNDTRPIDEIIADDLRILSNLGISKEKLILALKDVYQKAKNGFGAEVAIRPDVSVVFHESMGRIPSPFRGDGVFEKGEAVVTNKKTGETAIITSLSINLIEKHDFFQGKGCRYRLDPKKLVSILGISTL